MEKELIEKLAHRKPKPKAETYEKILHVRVKKSQFDTIMHYFGSSGNVRDFLVDSIEILQAYEKSHKKELKDEQTDTLPK